MSGRQNNNASSEDGSQPKISVDTQYTAKKTSNLEADRQVTASFKTHEGSSSEVDGLFSMEPVLLSRELHRISQMDSNKISEVSRQYHQTSTVTSSTGQAMTPRFQSFYREAGQGRVVGISEGNITQVRQVEYPPRIISQQTYEGSLVQVAERELTREISSTSTGALTVSQPSVETRQKQKVVEYVKEVPVPVNRYVDVKYDVVVDVPVERIFEKEKIKEIHIERPVEKIVQVPVKQIVEIPVEKIIERPVETTRIVETPIERTVARPYEVIRENLIYRDRVVDIDERDLYLYPNSSILPTEVNYRRTQNIIERPYIIDNVIEQQRIVPREEVIEVPKEKLVERKNVVNVDRPVPVERLITHQVEVPVEVPVYHHVDVIVERPRFVENIVNRQVPVERIIEVDRPVIVERLVEKPKIIENIIEKQVHHVVEVPVPKEEIIEVPVNSIQTNRIPFEEVLAKRIEQVHIASKPVVRQVSRPFNQVVERQIPVPLAVAIKTKVHPFNESPVDQVAKRPIKISRVREKAKEVEKIVEVPVEDVQEVIKYVEKIVEKPVEYETIIEKEVEVIVEKIIEVPVEKIVEVPVEIQVEVPVINDILNEDELILETENQVITEGDWIENNEEFEDSEFKTEINSRNVEVLLEKEKAEKLQREVSQLTEELYKLKIAASSSEHERHAHLSAVIRELTTRLQNAQNESRIRVEINQGQVVTETNFKVNPKMIAAQRKLEQAIAENQRLIAQARAKGTHIQSHVSMMTNIR